MRVVQKEHTVLGPSIRKHTKRNSREKNPGSPRDNFPLSIKSAPCGEHSWHIGNTFSHLSATKFIFNPCTGPKMNLKVIINWCIFPIVLFQSKFYSLYKWNCLFFNASALFVWRYLLYSTSADYSRQSFFQTVNTELCFCTNHPLDLWLHDHFTLQIPKMHCHNSAFWLNWQLDDVSTISLF